MEENFTRILLISLALLGLSGCATTPLPVPYNQKALGLKIGMDKEDVIHLLGAPKKVAARKTDKGLEEKYTYWGLSRLAYSYALIDNEMLSQDRLYVTLLDDKVVEWGDKYDPSTIMDKSLQITNATAKQYAEMYQKQLEQKKGD